MAEAYSPLSDILQRDRRRAPSRGAILAWLASIGAELPAELQDAPMPLLRGYMQGIRSLVQYAIEHPRFGEQTARNARLMYLAALNEACQRSPHAWAFLQAHEADWAPLWRDDGRRRGLETWPERCEDAYTVAMRAWWEQEPAAHKRVSRVVLDQLPGITERLREEAWQAELASDPAAAEKKRRDVEAWFDRKPPTDE